MLKALLIRKLIGLTKSSTAGVGGAIILVGGWIVSHPDVVTAVSPKWGGVIVSGVGFLVLLARTRSL